MGEISSLSSADRSIRGLFQGLAAGIAATVPIPISLLVGWTLLPRRVQYHLPPRMITEEIAERAGLVACPRNFAARPTPFVAVQSDDHSRALRLGHPTW